MTTKIKIYFTLALSCLLTGLVGLVVVMLMLKQKPEQKCPDEARIKEIICPMIYPLYIDEFHNEICIATFQVDTNDRAYCIFRRYDFKITDLKEEFSCYLDSCGIPNYPGEQRETAAIGFIKMKCNMLAFNGQLFSVIPIIDFLTYKK